MRSHQLRSDYTWELYTGNCSRTEQTGEGFMGEKHCVVNMEMHLYLREGLQVACWDGLVLLLVGT
jgi:hypothetical protein